MKFQPDTLAGVNMIARHDAGGIAVGPALYPHSVLVPWVGAVAAWPVDAFDALRSEHFEQILALRPDLVIFGSGPRQRFPAAALLRPLIERRIGVETMDTAAACRTYNVLASEGRRVAAALIVEPAAGTAGPS